jgi:hypothetical protein
MKALSMITLYLVSIFFFAPLIFRAEGVVSTAKIMSDRQFAQSSFLNDRSLAKSVTKNAIPSELRPSNNERLSFVSFAKGVQIYQCQAKKDQAGEFEWLFKAPEADLFDRRGKKKLGTHYGGPTWESKDGSKVVGKVKTRVDARKPDAIPWLLLEAQQVEGSGIFGKITSIQRLDTVGGKAPANGCSSTTVGKEVRVDYTATYYFYSPKQSKLKKY